jgi:hypothetical protein
MEIQFPLPRSCHHTSTLSRTVPRSMSHHFPVPPTDFVLLMGHRRLLALHRWLGPAWPVETTGHGLSWTTSVIRDTPCSDGYRRFSSVRCSAATNSRHMLLLRGRNGRFSTFARLSMHHLLELVSSDPLPCLKLTVPSPQREPLLQRQSLDHLQTWSTLSLALAKRETNTTCGIEGHIIATLFMHRRACDGSNL